MKTSLGPLIEFMQIRKDKQKLKKYIENHREFLDTTPDELFGLIAELLDAAWMIEKRKEYKRKDGVYTMCTGMKEWLDDVFQDGKKEGEIRGEQAGFTQACHIISEINRGNSVSAIASKYAVSENQVLMVIHAMRPEVGN